ncbi:hypothetical protein K438DRAFT_1749117 [Mycena galopus ATCC 62051]|nr:hypothetical protein K438DRAFT_1749117 [Mycena galopus ATCC 62051]
MKNKIRDLERRVVCEPAEDLPLLQKKSKESADCETLLVENKHQNPRTTLAEMRPPCGEPELARNSNERVTPGPAPTHNRTGAPNRPKYDERSPSHNSRGIHRITASGRIVSHRIAPALAPKPRVREPKQSSATPKNGGRKRKTRTRKRKKKRGHAPIPVLDGKGKIPRRARNEKKGPRAKKISAEADGKNPSPKPKPKPKPKPRREKKANATAKGRKALTFGACLLVAGGAVEMKEVPSTARAKTATKKQRQQRNVPRKRAGVWPQETTAPEVTQRTAAAEVEETKRRRRYNEDEEARNTRAAAVMVVNRKKEGYNEKM